MVCLIAIAFRRNVENVARNFCELPVTIVFLGMVTLVVWPQISLFFWLLRTFWENVKRLNLGNILLELIHTCYKNGFKSCKNRSFHDCDYEEYRLLVCYSVWLT
jgi:hypothetical protein